jgi:exopolyphosphatase / guanosine-5'-triphosphate,3'-diphosphate pyrophosphatase
MYAVIDIGSNSVRLVLYEVTGHHAQQCFNEKSACALGASLVSHSTLAEDAKQRVRATIARFADIIRHHQPKQIVAIATAAMRDAEDGAAFADELSDMLGHPIRVISGLEEARYAGLGVIATSYDPNGISADLGGGSLDVARVTPEGAVGTSSLATGTLRLSALYQQGGVSAVEQHVAAHCTQHQASLACDMVYAVGGSFRALAMHDMQSRHYPLRVVHDYVMDVPMLDALYAGMMERALQENANFEGVPSKRQDTVIPALVVLRTLMQYSGARYATFSSAGVREGVLHDSLRDNMVYDPLLAMIDAMPESRSDTPYRAALSSWIYQALPRKWQDRRIIDAFTMVSEMAIMVHPEQRAYMAYERMLATMAYGVSHAQQVLLALACYHRYKTRLHDGCAEVALLNEYERCYARLLGQLARVAHNISSGSAEYLQQFYVELGEEDVTINSRMGVASTLPDDVVKACEGLGDTVKALRSLYK